MKNKNFKYFHALTDLNTVQTLFNISGLTQGAKPEMKHFASVDAFWHACGLLWWSRAVTHRTSKVMTMAVSRIRRDGEFICSRYTAS